MIAKIIQFATYLKHYGPRTPMGFRFPGVYRKTGFSFLGPDWTAADRRRPHTEYSLVDDQERGVQIAEPVFTPIARLDPALDDGWIIVKRHLSPEIAWAYWEGQLDVSVAGDEGTCSVYQTPEGIFTLLHRKPRPNCENHLLIFTAFDPGFTPPHRPEHLPDGEFWNHIVRSTGEVVPGELYGSDDRILWSDED